MLNLELIPQKKVFDNTQNSHMIFNPELLL